MTALTDLQVEVLRLAADRKVRFTWPDVMSPWRIDRTWRAEGRRRSVTSTVKALVSRGLLASEPFDDDSDVAVLTDAGQAALATLQNGGVS